MTATAGRTGIDAAPRDLVDTAVSSARAAITSGDLALATVAGSYMYGLADPTRSDLDLRGAYVAPTADLLGLHRPAEQYQPADGDIVIYEIGKLMGLAADGNANVLEILFSPRFEVLTGDGAELVAVRDACLSRRAVSRYIGYASSQAKAAERIAAGVANGDGRFADDKRRKHIRHTFRLVAQADQMAREGHLDVVVSAALADELDVLCGLDTATVAAELDSRIAALKAAVELSDLRARPDVGRINDAVVAIRLRHLS